MYSNKNNTNRKASGVAFPASNLKFSVMHSCSIASWPSEVQSMVGRGQNDKFSPNLSYPIRMGFQCITKEFSLFWIWICIFLDKKYCTYFVQVHRGLWNKSLHGSHIQMNKSYLNDFTSPWMEMEVEVELHGTCTQYTLLAVEQGCCLEWLPSLSGASHLQYGYQGWHPLWVSPSHWAVEMNTKIHLQRKLMT